MKCLIFLLVESEVVYFLTTSLYDNLSYFLKHFLYKNKVPNIIDDMVASINDMTKKVIMTALYTYLIDYSIPFCSINFVVISSWLILHLWSCNLYSLYK